MRLKHNIFNPHLTYQAADVLLCAAQDRSTKLLLCISGSLFLIFSGLLVTLGNDSDGTLDHSSPSKSAVRTKFKLEPKVRGCVRIFVGSVLALAAGLSCLGRADDRESEPWPIEVWAGAVPLAFVLSAVLETLPSAATGAKSEFSANNPMARSNIEMRPSTDSTNMRSSSVRTTDAAIHVSSSDRSSILVDDVDFQQTRGESGV